MNDNRNGEKKEENINKPAVQIRTKFLEDL